MAGETWQWAGLRISDRQLDPQDDLPRPGAQSLDLRGVAAGLEGIAVAARGSRAFAVPSPIWFAA